MNTENSLLSKRILSIDIVRGLVMIIMALDHTRDFFHIQAMVDDPLNIHSTTAILYLTRWITHFCAPTFVFLSGLSTYLSAQNKNPAQASKFLLKRGFWLIIVEILIISLGITFNPFYNFIILQVIWAIGCSMILLALLSRISYHTVLIVGILLVFGHDIFTFLPSANNPALAFITKIFFTAFDTIIPLGNNYFIGDFYAILPWTGIMCLGYAAGLWFTADFNPVQRKRNLLNFGGISLILFVLLRIISIYGDPSPRKEYHDFLKNLLSFFNVSKYPPSLQYTSITIGVALILLASAEKTWGKIGKVLSVYGAVPFFYYVIHFYILHTLLVIVFFISGYSSSQISSSFFLFRPKEFGFDLLGVYLIWIGVVALLYLPCKWFKKYKATHDAWWLRYV